MTDPVASPDVSRDVPPLVMTGSLKLVASSHTLRCDSKQGERRFSEFERFIGTVDHFELGDFLPSPVHKGEQPAYLETLEAEAVPVISTLAIQQLAIVVEACRFISREVFDGLTPERLPRQGDVLLTMDGGTSIGKPVHFDRDEAFAIDSHVAILRPQGLDARLLVYLLASPLGQVQFHRAESGASGQTAVTEEDLRRFRFPTIRPEDAADVVRQLDDVRREITSLREQLHQREEEAWSTFADALVQRATPTSERA